MPRRGQIVRYFDRNHEERLAVCTAAARDDEAIDLVWLDLVAIALVQVLNVPSSVRAGTAPYWARGGE